MSRIQKTTVAIEANVTSTMVKSWMCRVSMLTKDAEKRYQNNWSKELKVGPLWGAEKGQRTGIPSYKPFFVTICLLQLYTC